MTQREEDSIQSVRLEIRSIRVASSPDVQCNTERSGEGLGMRLACLFA